MDTTTVLFYVFSIILLGASFRVITAKSTVHSALFLILAFFNATCVWMLLKAEFLAITLILVYVGAVMVLFLFVVMMLDVHTDTARKGFWKHLPLAGFIGAVVALEMAAILMTGFAVSQPKPFDPELVALAGGSNTKMLGIVIYTDYLYPLQVAAVLLLVAIIAAIALTLRERKDSRSQNPAEQVKVTKGDRLRIIQMDPVRPATENNKPEGAA
jgi:NADH-quinone oxidoreductase subunit J